MYDYQRAARIAGAGSVSPLRPRDFDIAAINRASSHLSEGEIGLLLRLWATEYYLDRGDLPQARLAFTQAEDVFESSASHVRASLHACVVVGATLTGRDAEATRRHWRAMQPKQIDSFDTNYWQAKCAFHWAEGRFDLAREAWRAGSLYLAELPDVGGNNYDRDAHSRLLEIIENGETHAVEALKPSMQQATTFPTYATPATEEISG